VSERHFIAGAAIIVERASAEAVAVLRDAGIRSILIKGPAQQQWLSAAGAPRDSVDVDLLLDPAEVDAAGSTLSALGYRHQPEVTPGVENHGDLWAAPGRVPVEIHWALSGTDPATTWSVLSHETEATEVSGTSVEIPNEAARCLIVTIHAAQHGVGSEATITDLERALIVGDRAAWVRAAELARAVAGEAGFAAGLGLVPSGKQLRHDLGLEAVPLTERVALDIAGPVDGAPGFYWLTQQKGVGAKVRFAARKLVPPADFMRFKYPYAREGTARLALAYLHRIVWVARSAIPGFLAWRRARRAARSDGRQSD
jgi:Uncharacterised nucleotidyltransferase